VVKYKVPFSTFVLKPEVPPLAQHKDMPESRDWTPLRWSKDCSPSSRSACPDALTTSSGPRPISRSDPDDISARKIKRMRERPRCCEDILGAVFAWGGSSSMVFLQLRASKKATTSPIFDFGRGMGFVVSEAVGICLFNDILKCFSSYDD